MDDVFNLDIFDVQCRGLGCYKKRKQLHGVTMVSNAELFFQGILEFMSFRAGSTTLSFKKRRFLVSADHRWYI